MPTPLKRRHLLSTLLIATATVVACQPAPSITPAPEKEMLIGAAEKAKLGDGKFVPEASMKITAALGGVITTPDGHLKLVIPPGALSNDTTVDVAMTDISQMEVKPFKNGDLLVPAYSFKLDLHGAMINTDQAITVTGQADPRFVLSTAMTAEYKFGAFEPAEWGIGKSPDGTHTMTMQIKGPQTTPSVPEFGSKEWYLWEWGEVGGQERWEADQSDAHAGPGHYGVQHAKINGENYGDTSISGPWFSLEGGSMSGEFGCGNFVQPACNDPGGSHGYNGNANVPGGRVELWHCVLTLMNDPGIRNKISASGGISEAEFRTASNACKAGDTQKYCSNPIPEKPDDPKPAGDDKGGNVTVTWSGSDEPAILNNAAYPAYVRFWSKHTGTVDVPTGTGGKAGMSFPEIWLPIYETAQADTDGDGNMESYTYIKDWYLEDYPITIKTWYHNGVQQKFGDGGSTSFLSYGPVSYQIPKYRPKVNLVGQPTGTPIGNDIRVKSQVRTTANGTIINQTWNNSNHSFQINPKVHPDYQSGDFTVEANTYKVNPSAWVDIDDMSTAKKIHYDESYSYNYNVTYNSTITGKFFYDSNDVSVPADQQPLEDQYKWNDKPANQITSVVFAHPVSQSNGRPTGSTADRPLENTFDDLTFSNVDASRLAWGVSGKQGNVNASKDVTCGNPLVGSGAYTSVAGGEVNVDIKAPLPLVEIPVTEELSNLSLVMRYRLVRKDDPSVVIDRIMNLPKAVSNKITFSLPVHDPLHQAKCWRFEPYRIEDPTFEYQVFTPTNDFNYPSVDDVSRGQPKYMYPVTLKALWVAPKYRVRGQ